MTSGIIVINATKIDTLNAAINQLKVSGFLIDISQVSISRTKEIGDGQYLSALNPVFIIKGER
jgi:precorrin-6B methylase 2